MKNLSVKDLLAKLAALGAGLKRYAVFIFILAILGMYGFLVLRINQLTGSEPSDSDVAAKLQTVQRPKVDQSTIDKLQQLQGTNIQVQSLFKQARQNPFQE